MESEIISSALFFAGTLALGAALYTSIQLIIKSDSREDFYRMKWERAKMELEFQEECIKEYKERIKEYKERIYQMRIDLIRQALMSKRSEDNRNTPVLIQINTNTELK